MNYEVITKPKLHLKYLSKFDVYWSPLKFKGLDQNVFITIRIFFSKKSISILQMLYYLSVWRHLGLCNIPTSHFRHQGTSSMGVKMDLHLWKALQSPGIWCFSNNMKNWLIKRARRKCFFSSSDRGLSW